MLQKYNRFRVLEVFFRHPTTDLQLRQVSREAGLAPPSVKRYLRELVRKGLVLETRGTIYKAYQANRDSEQFRRLRAYTLCIQLSPLVDEIRDACLPDAIVLFGSARKGDDTEASDIDIAVLAKEVKLNLRPHEKLLNRKISVMFFPSFGNLSEELKNNILNGIKLYGYVIAYPHREGPGAREEPPAPSQGTEKAHARHERR